MQGPYRPPPQGPDPELQRLAMQGEQRRLEAVAGHDSSRKDSGERHLRTAIGAYRGSTLKRVLLAVILVALVSGAGVVVMNVSGNPELGMTFVPCFSVAFILFFFWAFLPPIASKGAVAAEQSWLISLPFQLTGYFELLSSEPRSARSIGYQIRWREGTRPPDSTLLHSVFCAADPQARLEHADANGASIRGGAVSGQTGIRVNRSPVYRNHRLPGHIHAVIDQVLLTLHRSHPIAEVTLTHR